MMLLWTAFVILIMMFPTSVDPTAQQMNYTVAVFGGWILLCIVYYYLPVYGGVHWFKGPIANVPVEPGTPVEKVSVDGRDEKKEEGSVEE